jgi:hypothetical protein
VARSGGANVALAVVLVGNADARGKCAKNGSPADGRKSSSRRACLIYLLPRKSPTGAKCDKPRERRERFGTKTGVTTTQGSLSIPSPRK